MKRITTILCLLLFFCLFSTVKGQISKYGTPPSWQFPLKVVYAEKVISLDNISYTKVAKNSFLKSLQVAHSVDVNSNITNEGTWTRMPDGSRICRIKYSCAEAKALLCYFSVFEPVAGAKLFIYSSDRKNLLGAFDAGSCGVKGKLAVVPLPGNNVIIEYALPANSFNTGQITLKTIDVDTEGKTLIPKAGEVDCYNNVICSQALGWENEINSVVRLSIKQKDGTLYCTGVLVNNTVNANKFYILTANHCISDKDAAANTIVYFNYEGATCSDNVPIQINTVSGAELVATLEKTDFSLIQINTLPFEYKPFMSGWDLSDQTGNNFAIIHHPEGWVKKITKTTNPVTVSSYSSFQSDGFWKVFWTESSTAEGSSGGPLFNSDHKIIGNLTGGYAMCGNNSEDLFSRTKVSWALSSDSIAQLKYWLDPQNQGLTSCNGRYVNNHNEEGYSYFTNMNAMESSVYQSVSTNQYPTSSIDSYNGVAEEFDLSKNINYKGFYIIPAYVSHHDKKNYVKFELHQDGLQGDTVLFTSQMSLDSFITNKAHFISFQKEINLHKNTKLYIDWSNVAVNDTFAMSHAAYGKIKNTAYIIQNNTLQSFTEAFGNEYNTSLSVWLKSTISDDLPIIKADKMLIGPNPSNGYFEVNLTNWKRPIELSVTDLYGRMVYKSNITAYDDIIPLQLQYLISGMYLVKAKTSDRYSENKVLIIK